MRWSGGRVPVRAAAAFGRRAWPALVIAWALRGAPAAAAPAVVRVGLVGRFPSPSALVVEASAGAELRGADGAVLARGPAAWRFAAHRREVEARDGDRDVGRRTWLRVEPGQAPLAVALPGSASRAYRGALEVRAEPGRAGPRLLLVNEAPLEEYLRGVIALEMAAGAPREALLAQCVVARTYAVRGRRGGGRPYDLTDTTSSQVYGGVAAETDLTDAALRATAGMALLRYGDPIGADYFDDCGGVTAVGAEDSDWPPSVVDRPGPGGRDFCAAGRYHTWQLVLTPGELGDRLAGAGRARIGTVREVTVSDCDASGRARRVRVAGEVGVEEMAGAAFRAALGYARLRSTLFVVSRGEGGAFVFDGRGNGHGRGMCQQGARGMAAAGRTCAQILEHYFPGAILAPLPARG